nr:integrin alpha [Kofleriaceae bacterium]
MFAIAALGTGACLAQSDAGDPIDTPSEGSTAQAISGGAIEAGDMYGYAVAAGDFDGDGIQDLAIGAPGEKPGSGKQTGSVFIYKGGTNGMSLENIINEADIKGATVGNGDQFGFALAVVPGPGSAKAQLIIGAPGGQTSGAASSSGVVYVLQGGTNGPNPALPTILGQTRDGVGVSETGDQFGASVAYSGGLLAVGVPGELHGGTIGYVNTYTLASNRWTAGPGLDAPSAGHGSWGHTVAVGNFNGDHYLDVAAATDDNHTTSLYAVQPDPDHLDGTGAIAIYPGTSSGFGPAIVVTDPGNAGGDAFGWSLAVGQFDGNATGTAQQLAVGSPGFSRTGSVSANGRVYVLTFSPTWGRQTWVMTSSSGANFGTSLAAGRLTSTTQPLDDLVTDLLLPGPGQLVVLSDSAGGVAGRLSVQSKNTPMAAFTSGGEVSEQWALSACIGRFTSASGSSPAGVVTGDWNTTIFLSYDGGNANEPEDLAGAATQYIPVGTDQFPLSRLWDEAMAD